MILVIEGLPSTTSASELRELVKLQTNVTEYMLDDLAADELGYMVARLHVRDSNEGSLIMQVLDGSLYAAHRLRVRPLIESTQSQGGGAAYYGGTAGAASAVPSFGTTQHYPAYPAVAATPAYIPVQQVAGSGVAAYGTSIQPVIHSSVAVYRTGYGESYALPGTDPRAHQYAPAIAQVHQQDPLAYQKRLGEPRMKDDYTRHKDRRMRSRSRSPRSRSPPRDRLPRRFRNERRSRSFDKVPPPPPQISRVKRDKSSEQDYNVSRKPVNKKTEKTFQEAYPDGRDIQPSRRESVKSLKVREFGENDRSERNDTRYAPKAATAVRQQKDIPNRTGPIEVRSVYEDSNRADGQTQFATDGHLKRHKDTGSIYIESKRSISGSNNMPNTQRRYFQDDNNVSNAGKSRDMQNKGRGNQFSKDLRDEPFSSTKKSPQRTPPIEHLRYEKSSSKLTEPIPNKKQHQEPMRGKPNDFINKTNVESKSSRIRLQSPSPEPAYKTRVPGKFQTQVKQQTFSKGQTPPLEKRFRKNTYKTFSNDNKQTELYNEVRVNQVKSSGPGRNPQSGIEKSTKNTHPINEQSYSKSLMGNDTKQHSAESKIPFDVHPRVGNKTHFDKNKPIKKDIRKAATDDNPGDRHYPSHSRHREQEIRPPVRDVRPSQGTTESTSDTRLVWEDVNVLDDQYTPPRPSNNIQVPDDPWAPNTKPKQVDEIRIKSRPIMRSAGQLMQDSNYNSSADTRMLYKTNREPMYGRASSTSEDKANPPLVLTPPLPDHFVGKDRRRIINEKRIVASSINERAFPKAAVVSKQHDEQVGSGRVISREYTEMHNERNFDDRRSRQNKPAAYVEERPLLLDKKTLPIDKKPVIQAYDSREQVPVDYSDSHTIHEDRKIHPRHFREHLSRDGIVRVIPDQIARNPNRRSRSHEPIYAENKRRPMTPPRLVQNVAPMVDDRSREASKYTHRHRRVEEEMDIRQRPFSKHGDSVQDGLVDVRRPSEAHVPRSPQPDCYDYRRHVEFGGRQLSPHRHGDRQHPPHDMYDEYQQPPRDMYDDRRRPPRGFDDREQPSRDPFDERQGPPRDEFNDRHRPPRDEFDDRQRPLRDAFDDRQPPPRDVYDDRPPPPRDVYDDRQPPPRDVYNDRHQPTRDVYDGSLPEMYKYRQAPASDMYVDRPSDLRTHDRRSPYIRPGSPGYEDWKYTERILSPDRHPRYYHRPATFDDREMPRDLRFEEEKSIIPLPEYRHEGYGYDSRQHDAYVSPRHGSGDINAQFDDYFDKRYPERHIHTEVYPNDQPEYPYSPRRSREDHLVESVLDPRREYQVDPLHEETYHKDNFDLRMQLRHRDRDADQEHLSYGPSRTFEDDNRNVHRSIKDFPNNKKHFVKPFKPQPKFSARPRVAARLLPKHLKEARQPGMKPRKLQNEGLANKIVKPSNKTEKIELPINAEDGRYLATNKLAFITMKHHEDLLPNFRLRKRAMIDMRKLIGDRIDRMFKDRFVTNIQAIVKEYRTKYSSKADTETLKKIIDGLPAFIKSGRAAPKNTSKEVETTPSPKKLSTQSPKKLKGGVSTVRKRPATTLTAKVGRKPEQRTVAKKSKVQR